MKKILTLALILTSLFASSQTKNSATIWTKEYEQEVYNLMHKNLGAMFKNEEQVKDITIYTVARLKTALPNGLLSVPDDSVKTLCAKIGADYAITHKSQHLTSVIAWSSDVESGMKLGILHSSFMKYETQEIREKACDCFIKELKKMYPDTVRTPLPDSVIHKIGIICRAQSGAAKN